MPKRYLALFLLCGLGLTAAGYCWWTRDRLDTDDAFVDGHIHIITPRIAGYVATLDIVDNQKVTPGQPLLRLDPREFELTMAEARAGLTEAEAALAAIEIGVPLESDQTALRVTSAQAQLESLCRTIEKTAKEEEAAMQEIQRAAVESEQANLDLNRLKRLVQIKVISQSDVDRAHSLTEISTAQTRWAKARLEGVQQLKASLTADMNRVRAEIGLAAAGEHQVTIKTRQAEAQRAKVELARARMHKAELELSWTVITSPAYGFITKKRVESGQHVAKGQALLAIVPLDTELLWITANYKETQLALVHPGQHVDIKVDTYPGIRLNGVVDSIMAGTGSAFSLFPPENASGNYVKVVQRIPVKIILPPEKNPEIPQLRVGMSVVPTIRTGG